MRVTSTIDGDAAARPHDRPARRPCVTRVSPLATERVSSTGFSVTPARSDPPAPAMNSTVQSEGSQFSPMRSTTARTAPGISAGTGRKILVEDAVERILAGGRGEEQAQAGPGHGGVDLLDDRQRVGDVGAAPAEPRIGDLEVAPRRRFAPAHADAGRRHVEAAAGLMLGQHAGDVVVDDDHLVDLAEPIAWRRCRRSPSRSRPACAPPAARRRSAPRPPARRRCGRRRSLIATGSPAQSSSRASQVTLPSFFEPPVRWRTPPIESICEPYSAVVTWPTCSPSTRIGAASGPEMAVGVDLHLDAAIAEDALGHDRDRVDAVVLGSRR